MRIGIFGLAIFLAGLAPGLLNHGRPLPNSGHNMIQPVAAYSTQTEKPPLLSLLVSRLKKTA